MNRELLLPTFVTFLNSQGVDARGTVLKLSQGSVVIEVYNPESIAQLSEVLSNFIIYSGETKIYQGRAVVSSLVNTGMALVVTATLVDKFLTQIKTISDLDDTKKIVRSFINEWEICNRLNPDYRLIVDQISSLWGDINHWISRIESTSDSRNEIDNISQLDRLLDDVLDVINPELDKLLIEFEEISASLSSSEMDIHKMFARKHLHPLMLLSPFPHRAITKPLGYAGDFETINLLTGRKRIGPTAFAKLINEIHLNAEIAVAHKNRIKILIDYLIQESARMEFSERQIRILSVGCGPALEIQAFLREHSLADRCHFTLIDFEQKALEHVESRIAKISSDVNRNIKITYIRQSVQSYIKQAIRNDLDSESPHYDLVYCARLFDYLSDKISSRLIKLFYQRCNKGGLVIVTNVHLEHRMRFWMEHALDWYLIYRNEQGMEKLLDKKIDYRIFTDKTDANIFLELRK